MAEFVPPKPKELDRKVRIGCLGSLGDDMELLGVFIKCFYIDVRGDKVVLHHQDRIH